MFPSVNNFRLVGSVLGLSTNENSILCADNFYNICTFSKQTKVIEESLQLSKSAESLHPFSKCISISHSSSKVAVGFSKNSQGIVLNATDKIFPVATLTWQKLEITKIAFSPKDNYFATGGEDGRVLVYVGESYNFLLSLPPFPDYISAIAFNEEESLVFGSCYSGKTMIFDIVRNSLIATFESESVIEDAFFYDDNSKVFCVCKNGKIFSYNIKQSTFINTNTLHNAWLTVCQRVPDSNYALVGGRDNLLHFISLDDGSLLDNIIMDNRGLTALHFKGNLIYLGWSDGALQVGKLDTAKEEMLEALNNNNLTEALKIINEKNIFLKTLGEYQHKLESLWKETLAKAIDLLAKNQFDEVNALAKPFMSDIKKKEELDYYWQQKEVMLNFLDALEAKNYIEVYKLVEQNTYLKDSMGYMKVEELWEKSFEVCKKLLLQNAQSNIQKAQEILKPFANVKCKKDSVTMLLRNSDKYFEAEREYKAKNFVEYFKLTEKFPFLRETTIYRSALLVGEQIMRRVGVLEQAGDFEKAIEICKLLSSMAPFKIAAGDKTKSIQLKQEFIQLCNERKLTKAFEMAEESDELRSLPECKRLYDNFRDKCKIAFKYANEGDGEKVLNQLKEYLFAECWKDKIASILKIAYLTEFVQNAPGKEGALENISWKETFQYYIERYGKDEELKKVAAENNLQGELDSIPFDGNPKGYLTCIIADSLLSIDNQPLQEFSDKESKD